MPSLLIRIFSDLHYGDRASALKTLSSLQPLLDGPTQIVLNGDTLDTRPSRTPEQTATLRAEVSEFFSSRHPAVSQLTGNHDPDLSNVHALEFADRRVLVTHGDVLFEDMVPWSGDAPLLKQRIAAELSKVPADEREVLIPRLNAFRRAAITIPQRHQSEKNGFKYTLGYLADTVWPPLRVLRVIRAWREAPSRAEVLIARNKLPARFFVMGHTHRLGTKITPSGLVVINTGSLCPPGGAGVVDVTEERISLRRIERRGGAFYPGETLAEFSLAEDQRSARLGS